MDSLDTHHGLPHVIRREHTFDDVLQLFRDKKEQVLGEFPFRIRYKNEKAVDTGGVCRDMLSGFWDEAYMRAFDGGSCLVPALHPHMDMELFPILGTILSHSFLSSGFMPVRLAFPVLAATLLGPNVPIPDHILISSFADCLSLYESSIIGQALKECALKPKFFSDERMSQLVSILSRLGCREVSKPDNFNRLLLQVAKHEFVVKPLGALHGLSSGVPDSHRAFWKGFSVERLINLYNALNATPSQVLALIKEPEGMSPNAAVVFGYLTIFIGNLTQDELRMFLRFVTGSCVVVTHELLITFNSLTGLARRPISHTCSCTLELPTSYLSYLEFSQEFRQILNIDIAWAMDAI